MKAEKVTREMLRSISIGETVVFELPTAAACDSGKATACQMQNIDGVKYSVRTDYKARSLSITRKPL